MGIVGEGDEGEMGVMRLMHLSLGTVSTGCSTK